MKPTRDEKKAKTRRELLDAAAAVFAERGFVAASLDQVAERAGLAKGAVYSNFSSKEELFLSLLDEHLYEQLETIASLVDRDTAMRDQASEAGSLFMEFVAAERGWFLLWFEFTIYLARNPALQKRYGPRYGALRAATAAVIEQVATQHGIKLTMPAEHLAIAFFALGDGMALQKLMNDDVPDELFGHVIALVYDAMQHRAAAPSGR